MTPQADSLYTVTVEIPAHVVLNPEYEQAVADAELDDAERESGAYTAREPRSGR